MESVDEPLSVTLHVEHSSLTSNQGKLELHADVDDPDLWDEIVRRLEGFRVYTADNLQEVVLDLTKKKHQEELSTLQREKEDLRQRLEHSMQRVSALEQDLKECIQATVEEHKLKARA